MAEAQNRSMADAKLIRISSEAHRAVRLGAANDDVKMEEWASWALIQMAKQQGLPNARTAAQPGMLMRFLKKLFSFELPPSAEPRRPHPEGWHDDGKLPPVQDWECFDDRRVQPRPRRLRIKDLHDELNKEA